MPRKHTILTPKDLFIFAFGQQRLVILFGKQYWETFYKIETSTPRKGRIVIFAGPKSDEAELGIVLDSSDRSEIVRIRWLPSVTSTHSRSDAKHYNVHKADIMGWLTPYKKKAKLYRLYVQYKDAEKVTKQSTIRIDEDLNLLKKIQFDMEIQVERAELQDDYQYLIKRVKQNV